MGLRKGRMKLHAVVIVLQPRFRITVGMHDEVMSGKKGDFFGNKAKYSKCKVHKVSSLSLVTYANDQPCAKLRFFF